MGWVHLGFGMTTLERLLSASLFAVMAREYRRPWRLPLAAVDPTGVVRRGELPTPDNVSRREIVSLAVREALRWGQPIIETGPGATLFWAVPVMLNGQLLGGLVSAISEKRLFLPGSATTRFDLQTALQQLQQLAEHHNLTNAALLAAQRQTADKERHRAQAIHAYKLAHGSSLRAAYLLEEPALLAAVRAADRPAARAILNRLLVGMIHQAGARTDLAKSFFLELVVSLSRTAVEAGAAPQDVLGANYSSMTRLATLGDDEQISAWLAETLEHIFDAIGRRPGPQSDNLASRAMHYLQDHCTGHMSRSELADKLDVSISHLSRTLSTATGHSIPEIVSRLRVAKAAEWLAQTDKPLKIIALQAGFKDQSYFTKVFQRYNGKTPAQHRQEHAKAAHNP